MNPPCALRSIVLVMSGLVASGCASPGPAEPSSVEPLAPATQDAPSLPNAPLLPETPERPDEKTGLVAPDRLPVAEGDGILEFDLLERAPGTRPEQFEAWTAWVHDRFLVDPTPEQLIVLDGLLEEVPVVDATPVFINALHGLDMADPGDIVRAGAITGYWYVGQVRYKQVVLDADPADVLPQHVRNRRLVVDGWIRMWKRTLEQEGGVERFRARVAMLIADRKAARELQQREYEEKLKQRAEEAAREEAEAAAAAEDEPA